MWLTTLECPLLLPMLTAINDGKKLSLSISTILDKLYAPADAASLAFFRITFACIMLYSQIRFIANGWVYSFYIKPTFLFKYYGFYWVHPLPGNWMYLPWIAMI